MSSVEYSSALVLCVSVGVFAPQGDPACPEGDEPLGS